MSHKICNFVLVRLAQTEQSANDVVSGKWQESGLSHVGHEQSQALAKRIEAFSFVALYSSPSLGAIETANHISTRLNLPVQIEETFREIGLGILESQSRETFHKTHPNEYRKFFEDVPVDSGDMPIIPGAETRNEALRRSLSKLRDLSKIHSGGNVIVVTHGHLIKVIICGLQIGFEKIWCFNQTNTSLNIISLGGKIDMVHVMGDLAHLEMVGLNADNVKKEVGGMMVLQ